MCDTCDDSRFELIEKYKQKLLDATNIGDNPEEMAVIDNILFRFWQMGWLEKLELFGNSEQLDCSDCVTHGGDWDCDHVQCHKGADTISRAAVVDAIEGVDWYHINKNGEMVHGANDNDHQAWYKAEDIYKAVGSVPSAQSGCEDAVYRKAVQMLLAYFVPEERYAEAVDGLRRLPSAQPGWIPCSERMPKPNEEDGNGFHKAYLVQDGRWMDVARWNGKYWVAWGYSTVLLNVVAWCELPTPYREGGHDGED